MIIVSVAWWINALVFCLPAICRIIDPFQLQLDVMERTAINRTDQ